jgi:hypothetical protein
MESVKTHAAVAAKFSTLRAVVTRARATENAEVKTATMASRSGILSTKYKTTIDRTGNNEARNVLRSEAGSWRCESS